MAVLGVPIKNSTQVFPAHRIYCVARNDMAIYDLLPQFTTSIQWQQSR
jgi:hypothetical protein